MKLLRIASAEPLPGFRLRLTLTDGRVVERDLSEFLSRGAFERIGGDEGLFRKVRVQDGTVVWPEGLDMCPDVLIWGGAPPEGEAQAPPEKLKIAREKAPAA